MFFILLIKQKKNHQKQYGEHKKYTQRTTLKKCIIKQIETNSSILLLKTAKTIIKNYFQKLFFKTILKNTSLYSLKSIFYFTLLLKTIK